MIRVALLVAGKDLRIEAHARVVLWQVLPFSVVALILAGFALGPSHAGHSQAGPGLFYLVTLLVTLLVTNRSRALEGGEGTRASVATLGLDPAGVFLGKALALAVELWAIGAVLLAGSVLILHTPLSGTLDAVPSVLVTLGALACAGALYGALCGGAGSSTLLPAVAFPGFVPLLVAGERSFHAALYGGGLRQWWLISLVALAAYVALGVLLYGVLEESW